jgi:hypothetical protein
MSRLLATLLLCLVSVSAAFSQQASQTAPTNPCTAAEQKQLDFWVGEWDLTWPGQKAGQTGHGTNSVRRILDGCVVQENFSGENSAPLRGTSVSLFDSASRKWKQTWVDNQGAYMDFTGGIQDGFMTLQRESILPNGSKGLQRMVWRNVGVNEFDWSWESSSDGGKTWQVQWPVHYKRKS